MTSSVSHHTGDPLRFSETFFPSYKKWLDNKSFKYHQYRQAWDDFGIDADISGAPLNVDIEITNSCNLKCTMCPRTDLIGKGEFWPINFINVKDYRYLINDLYEKGSRAIKFNFLGEPLLHPEIINFISIAKDIGYLDVMFNSNGTLLTPQMSHNLLTSGLDKLMVSFDGSTPQTYESIRVGADYKKVFSNIKEFRRIRDDAFSDPIKTLLRVSMTVQDLNQAEVDSMKSTFAEIVDCISFNSVIDYEKVSSDLQKRFMEGELNPESVNGFRCNQTYQRMFLHPDGVVTPCCHDNNRDLLMGNTKEDSPSGIWTNQMYENLRTSHYDGSFLEKFPACRTCIKFQEFLDSK